MAAQLLEVCYAPHRPGVRFIRDTALTALVDKHTLQFMNEGRSGSARHGRPNMTKKHFGTARILTEADALRKEAKEQQAMNEKKRRAALAEATWKDLPMGNNVPKAVASAKIPDNSESRLPIF